MEYTEDQQKFIDGVKDFIYEDFPRKSYITLQGGAGSGKSTVIVDLPNLFPNKKFIFIAYTGRACDNLMKKGVKAQTIYSTFYRVKKEVAGLEFEPLTKWEVPHVDVIVIDEVSMVSQEMFNQLLLYNMKIIAVGDKSQLGPVKANRNSLLENPDYELTVIHRQEETSGIIRLANEFKRIHTFPSYGKYSDDVIIIPRDKVTKEMILSVNQAICGTNETRNHWNSLIRRAYNRMDYYPEVGERVICCKNTPIELGNRRVINGTTGDVTKVKVKGNNRLLLSFKPDWAKEEVTLQVNGENFVNGEFKMNIPNVYCFDFAYVITVNKAQGSEWESVLYIVDKEIPGESFFRNVNTGITRASKKLILAY